jgi:uncharacterized membrane protein YeaQ/YmgE (transglycosylase-associated protein family)
MGIMHIIWMLIVGLIVGAIARFIMPGVDTMSWLMTAILGVAGSFVGGLISSVIWRPKEGQAMLHPAGFIMSVIGCLLILWIVRHFNLVS